MSEIYDEAAWVALARNADEILGRTGYIAAFEADMKNVFRYPNWRRGDDPVETLVDDIRCAIDTLCRTDDGCRPMYRLVTRGELKIVAV